MGFRDALAVGTAPGAMRRPPLDLSLKLPPRPDDDAVREYYERQLAEGGDDGYESTGYATSGVGESSRRAPPPDPFRHDPALASPPRRRRELPRDDVDAAPAPVDRRAPRSRATAPSPIANGGPFTGDLDRYGDGTSRGAASWRSFGSSADDPSGSGRDRGRRPSPRGGPASTEHAPSEPPSELPTPMPSQRDMAEERDASPARRARRDARRRAKPSGHFYVADRDEDDATPRLDDDGDGTGDDALGLASKTHDQLPTPLRDPNRREGDQNRRGSRRRSRARAGAAAFGGAAPGGSRAREEARSVSPDARGGVSPEDDARGSRSVSLALGGVFSPDAPASGSHSVSLALGGVSPEDAPASSHPRSLSASDAAARAIEEARLETLKSRGLMTASEVTAHYRRARVRALRATGGAGGPGRVRHPKSLWNGDRPGLCRLTRPGGGRGAAAHEEDSAVTFDPGAAHGEACWLSRTYTEGSLAPTAFAAPPPAETLCRACGDVAWDPCKDLAGESSHVWCRDCLRVARGDAVGDAAPSDPETSRRIATLKILCRNALTCAKNAADGSLTWRMDKEGCPDIARLADRASMESHCAYAVEECGLPRGANPGDRCARRCRRRDASEHRADCEHRLVSCAHAGCARMIQSRYAEAHRLLCERRPFACPNRPRCGWTGTRIDADAHLEECEWETVPCGLVDPGADPRDERDTCGVRLPRREMGAHRDVCRFQREPCRHCGERISLRRLGEHESRCEERTVECSKCGARVPRDAMRTHDASVCPAAEVPCEYAGYGCEHRVRRGEYRAHSKEFFREHLRLVLDNDKNTTGTKERGGIGGEGDVDTDATVGSKDGFRAMHTRHELTRRDVRVVAETIRECTAAAEENLAIIRDDARRAADERDDAARRFALEMDAARRDFARRAKEVETLVDSSESELTDALANLWAESSDSRRLAERSLAPAGTLDDDASRAMDALNTAAVRQTDASRALGATLLSLAAAAAPALEIRAELEISARQQTEALAKLVSEAEWRAADRAVVAWERLGDVRENFKALVVPREHARAALEEKIAALEARRFVTAAEDALIRAESRGMVVERAGGGAGDGGGDGGGVRAIGSGVVEGEGAPPAPGTPPEGRSPRASGES